MPCRRRLIIDKDIRLGKEPRETLLDVKLPSRCLSVFGSAGAPAIQRGSAAMKLSNVAHDGADRDALSSERANQGVVNVHMSDHPN